MALLDELNLEHLNTSTLESGDVIATLNIGSNMLPHVTIDTYSTFDGSSFFNMEADNWVVEHGFVDGEVDVNVSDAEAIRRELGQLMLDAMSTQLLPWTPCGDERVVVTPGELTSTYAPRSYNFKTDSFAADYVVNLTALSEWLETWGIDAEAYGLDNFRSRDGFHSYIPGRLDDYDGERTETLVWLGMYAFLESELDEEELRFAGAEAEADIYMNNTTASCNHRVYTDRLVKRVAELAAHDVESTDGLIAEWSEAAGVEIFGETPHPSELLERVETDAQTIAAHVIASI